MKAPFEVKGCVGAIIPADAMPHGYTEDWKHTVEGYQYLLVTEDHFFKRVGFMFIDDFEDWLRWYTDFPIPATIYFADGTSWSNAAYYRESPEKRFKP